MSVIELIGKTLVSVETDYTFRYGDKGLLFICSDGTQYAMHHTQDCCESVYLEDTNGDWSDLLDTPILVAEERSEDQHLEWDVGEWTFYTFRTIKGSVDLRWNGTSNGYYSTSVNFYKVT